MKNWNGEKYEKILMGKKYLFMYQYQDFSGTKK